MQTKNTCDLFPFLFSSSFSFNFGERQSSPLSRVMTFQFAQVAYLQETVFVPDLVVAFCPSPRDVR